MSCCFSSHILTRAEREAIARLREQRATGKAPIAATHRAHHHSHQDPIVTFYTNPSRVKPLSSPKPRPPRPVRPPRPIRPPRQPRPANQPVHRTNKPKTAHQQKKQMRQAAKRTRPIPNDPQSVEKAPPVNVLVEKLRNVVTRENLRTEVTDTNTLNDPSSALTAQSASSIVDTAESKENSLHRFRAATKKRFENVKNKFGNNHPTGERFVLQPSPIADASDSNNDQYFQDLMKSDS